jgi:hypothetical protein
MFLETTDEWLHNHDTWPLEWRRVAGASDYPLSLTATQLEALLDELQTVIRRHRDAADARNLSSATSDAAVLDGPADEAEAFLAQPQPVFLYLLSFPKGQGPL